MWHIFFLCNRSSFIALRLPQVVFDYFHLPWREKPFMLVITTFLQGRKKTSGDSYLVA
jgi:hypothetical protein